MSVVNELLMDLNYLAHEFGTYTVRETLKVLYDRKLISSDVFAETAIILCDRRKSEFSPDGLSEVRAGILTAMEQLGIMDQVNQDKEAGMKAYSTIPFVEKVVKWAVVADDFENGPEIMLVVDSEKEADSIVKKLQGMNKEYRHFTTQPLTKVVGEVSLEVYTQVYVEGYSTMVESLKGVKYQEHLAFELTPKHSGIDCEVTFSNYRYSEVWRNFDKGTFSEEEFKQRAVKAYEESNGITTLSDKLWDGSKGKMNVFSKEG